MSALMPATTEKTLAANCNEQQQQQATSDILSHATEAQQKTQQQLQKQRQQQETNEQQQEQHQKQQQQQIAESDSGKSSSCSPAPLLDCSFDSGIGVMDANHDTQLQLRLQQCQRILLVLSSNKEAYRLLRDRLSKLVDKKNKSDAGEEVFCNVCCAEVNLNDIKSFVTCCTCKKRICRGIKCADWQPQNAQWECQLCHTSKESLAQTSSWVAEQMSFNEQKYIYPLRARSEIYIPISDCNDSSMHFESVSQIGVNSAAIGAEQKMKIREYVEEVVANMLGSSLDHIKVAQLSKSENYLPAILNGHNALNNNNNNSRNDVPDFGNISQTRLRQLIEAIIAETLRSSGLSSSTAATEIAVDTRSIRSNGDLRLSNGDVKRRHRTEHYFEPKIYQDLLATAVLNKIADKEGNTRLLSESTPDLSAHNIDQNYNVEALSTTSGSSVEPRSDCSFTDMELVLNTGKTDSQQSLNLAGERESVLSDYIAAHMVPLPDLSASVTESDDDFGSVTSSMIGEGTWEDNWLFKKKRNTIQSTTNSSSVGMLVPAPTEHVRAQIGDKTADEVSDLSEMGSDTDDSSLDILRSKLDPLNDRLLSAHLIGGKNTKLVLDELVDRTSMTSNTIPADNDEIYTETKNSPVIQAATAKNEAEDIKTVTCTNDDSLVAVSSFDDVEIDHNSNAVPGSIADRESKKWSNAVEMPNNPYAPDALKRRISGTQERYIDIPNISPSTEQNPIAHMTNVKDELIDNGKSRENDYKRYSRDYYINDAMQTTKSPLTHDLSSSQSVPSVEPSADDIVINEAQKALSTAAADDDDNNALETTTYYKALPAQVVEENASSIETLSNQSMQSINTTTSDDSDTVRVYDFKKQETTIIRPDIKPMIASSISTSIETAASLSPSETPKKKERPTDLQFVAAAAPVGDATTTTATGTSVGSPSYTPTRGSTPTAFKFLQPKRKLIEPSQVLSIDEDESPIAAATPEKQPVIEHEVVQSLPSVKALARAFLLTSRSTQSERRWSGKAKTPPATPQRRWSVARQHVFEACASVAEIADESTIASDLSSLETDPSVHMDVDASKLTTPTTEAGKSSPTPVRRGFLKSNIAFFENLKFK